MRVHQMGSVLCFGDAVTNHITEIDRQLAAWGYDTAIYGADISAARLPKAQRDTAYVPFLDQEEDILIYHYSAYCENASLFARSRNLKVLIYHNITPAEFFRPYDRGYWTLCEQGRRALPGLAPCDLALGVSDYNRRELVAAGFAAQATGVLPLFLSMDGLLSATRDESLYRRLRDGSTNILFVGRVAPNKAFEDLIQIFYAYHRYINPRSRLVLAGARFLPAYDRVLDALIAHLGLADAVRFTGRISGGALKSCYQAADLFLCASQHEGFCAPLLEAMQFDVPVVARAAAAVPETLGLAGVQYHVPDPATVAETMNVILSDGALRDRIVATQRQRLAGFAPGRVADHLREIMRNLCRYAPTR